MILVLEIWMEKMRSRRRSLFLFSFPSFFSQNLFFWRRQTLSNPWNVCLGTFVITKKLGCSLQFKETSWNTFFTQHCQSLLWLPPTLGKQVTHWSDDIQPLLLLTHSSSASCWCSRWGNAPFSSSVQLPTGFSQLASTEVPSALTAQTSWGWSCPPSLQCAGNPRIPGIFYNLVYHY